MPYWTMKFLWFFLINPLEILPEYIKRKAPYVEAPRKALTDKIAEGKVNKFLKENTLLSQALVKNPKQSVEQFIKEADKEATVVAYKRFALEA